MSEKVIIIGGGLAGISAATALSQLGVSVTLLEKENQLGGHVKNWDRLFPTRRKSDEVLAYFNEHLGKNIDLHFRANIRSISRNGGFTVTLENEVEIKGDALLIATGYELFDAFRKEEYGYDIYNQVITSAELEGLFRSGEKPLFDGKAPRRIGIVHCVGSRDEKVGNLYCSKVCCVTGVKQAIELREIFPETEIFNFYMDLRMFDRHFEEMYFEAQKEYGINFIRGRVSECAENQDNSIVVKVEDTLTGRPLKITVDLLVLLVGMVPRPETRRIADMLGLPMGDDKFLLPTDEHTKANQTPVQGVFLSGTVKGPGCIAGTVADGRAVAVEIKSFLDHKRTQD
jgi:heterodisulfide reductase subunit A2